MQLKLQQRLLTDIENSDKNITNMTGQHQVFVTEKVEKANHLENMINLVKRLDVLIVGQSEGPNLL